MSKKNKKILVRPGMCPKCGGTDLDYGGSRLDGELLGYDWDCPDCLASGTEWHRLEFSSHAVLKPGKRGSYEHYSR